MDGLVFSCLILSWFFRKRFVVCCFCYSFKGTFLGYVYRGVDLGAWSSKLAVSYVARKDVSCFFQGFLDVFGVMFYCFQGCSIFFGLVMFFFFLL